MSSPLVNGPLSIIAVHSGAGARDPGTAAGPRALRAGGLEAWFSELGIACRWDDVVITASPASTVKEGQESNEMSRLDRVADAARQVSEIVEREVRAGHRFLVIGGDHSIAVGTWSGVSNALSDTAEFGLVWLDAHLDSHVPETSPSGNWHGMPVAHLLGHGEGRLAAIARNRPAVSGDKLVLVGVRSFEPEEPRLLKLEGVRCISMADILEHGATACLSEALSIGRRGSWFGISIDVDVLDPRIAPGVGSPVPDGLGEADLISMLRGIAKTEGFVGLELAEFNPARDVGERTRDLIHRLLIAAFS